MKHVSRIGSSDLQPATPAVQAILDTTGERKEGGFGVQSNSVLRYREVCNWQDWSSLALQWSITLQSNANTAYTVRVAVVRRDRQRLSQVEC